MKKHTSWKTLVRDVIERLPRAFTLGDVTSKQEYFAKYYPNNRFIEAKIRQSLQILRDQGVIEFLGHGRYERTGIAQPMFSPFFDPSAAQGLISKTQIARKTIETWAELTLYCLNCPADELTALPPNTPVADLECDRCERRYQLKSKNGRFGNRIPGAAFGPTIEALRAGNMPDYVLIEYDTRLSIVVFASGIPGRYIGERCIVPRKALNAGARRAGWRGCTIDVGTLSPYRVPIVQPAGLDRKDVREAWKNLARGSR